MEGSGPVTPPPVEPVQMPASAGAAADGARASPVVRSPTPTRALVPRVVNGAVAESPGPGSGNGEKLPDSPPPAYESSDEEGTGAQFYHSSPGGAITAVPTARPVMNQVGNYRAAPAEEDEASDGAGAPNGKAARGTAGAGAGSGAGAGAGSGAGAGASNGRLARAGSSASAGGIMRTASARSMARRESTPEEVRERLICYFGLDLPYFHLIKHGRWGSPNVRRFWIDLFVGAQRADPAIRCVMAHPNPRTVPYCASMVGHARPCAVPFGVPSHASRRVLLLPPPTHTATGDHRWDAMGRGAKKPRTLYFSNVESVETGCTTKVLKRTGSVHNDHLYLSFIKKAKGSVDLQVCAGAVGAVGVGEAAVLCARVRAVASTIRAPHTHTHTPAVPRRAHEVADRHGGCGGRNYARSVPVRA